MLVNIEEPPGVTLLSTKEQVFSTFVTTAKNGLKENIFAHFK